MLRRNSIVNQETISSIIALIGVKSFVAKKALSWVKSCIV